MPSDAGAVRRWLDDILYHINLADHFALGFDYEAFHRLSSSSAGYRFENSGSVEMIWRAASPMISNCLMVASCAMSFSMKLFWSNPKAYF